LLSRVTPMESSLISILSSTVSAYWLTTVILGSFWQHVCGCERMQTKCVCTCVYVCVCVCVCVCVLLRKEKIDSLNKMTYSPEVRPSSNDSVPSGIQPITLVKAVL